MVYQRQIDANLIEDKVERLGRGQDRPAKLVQRAVLTAKEIAKLTELGAGRT